jgi:Tol biopolymer transport system component
MTLRTHRTAYALVLSLVAVTAATDAFGGKPVPPPPPPPPANPTIAYCDAHKSGNRTYGDLMVMNSDGSNKRPVLSVVGAAVLPNTSSVYGPDWSPDGQKLVFWNGALGGLCTTNLDGTGLTPIATTANTYGGTAQPSWSPLPVPGVLGNSAVRIAYADDVPPIGGQSVTEIFVMNSDGSDRRQVTRTPDIGEESPTWSPSGARLAFAMYTNDSATNHRTVGIYDFATDAYGVVTPGGALAGGTVSQTDWSKTSENQIAVQGITAAGVSGVWILDLSYPSNPVLIVGDPAQRPSWSQSDSQIVFQGNGIETARADGSGRTAISSTGKQPSWRRNP